MINKSRVSWCFSLGVLTLSFGIQSVYAKDAFSAESPWMFDPSQNNGQYFPLKITYR